jgi:diaminopimelate epimerase
MDYRIYSLGGNDTALVIGDDYSDYRAINDEIMAAHPNVEQVGFLSATEYKLTMAGGEFCGNASRAACFFYLDGKPGEIELQTCGMSVYCGIDESGDVWLKLPLPPVKQIDDGLYAVKLEGITHIVITDEAPPAVGMIILSKDAGGGIHSSDATRGGELRINPFVYVRSVDTFFNETACLSGTIAAAAVGGTDARVTQPSGNVIAAGFEKDTIKVSGTVTRLL